MAKRKRRRKNHTSASASTTATPSSQVNSGTNIKIPDPTGGYLNYEPDTAPTGQTDTESRLTRDHKKDEEDPYDKIRMADIWAEDEITRKKKVEQPSSSENPYLYRDENFEEDLNRQGYESTSSVGSSNLSGIDYTREEEERAEETRRRNLEAQEAELNNGRSSMDEQTVEAQWRQARGFLTDQSEQKLRDSVFAFPSHEHTSTSGETEEKKVDFAPDPKQQNYSATGSAEFNSALGASSVSASENGNYQSQQFISQADWGSHTHPAEEHVPQYGAENSNTIYQTQESAPVNDGNQQTEPAFTGNVFDAQAAYEQMLRGSQELYSSPGYTEVKEPNIQVDTPKTVDNSVTAQQIGSEQPNFTESDYAEQYQSPSYQNDYHGNSPVVEPASFGESPVEYAQRAYDEAERNDYAMHHHSQDGFTETPQESTAYQEGYAENDQAQVIPSGPLADAQAEYERMIQGQQGSTANPQDNYVFSDQSVSHPSEQVDNSHSHINTDAFEPTYHTPKENLGSVTDGGISVDPGVENRAEFNSAIQYEDYDRSSERDHQGNISVSDSQKTGYAVQHNSNDITSSYEDSYSPASSYYHEQSAYGHSGLEEAQRQYEQDMHTAQSPTATNDAENYQSAFSDSPVSETHDTTSAQNTMQHRVMKEPVSFSQQESAAASNEYLQNGNTTADSLKSFETVHSVIPQRVDDEVRYDAQRFGSDNHTSIVPGMVGQSEVSQETKQSFGNGERNTSSGQAHVETPLDGQQIGGAELNSGANVSQGRIQSADNPQVPGTDDPSYTSGSDASFYMAGRGGLEAAQADYDRKMHGEQSVPSTSQRELNFERESTPISADHTAGTEVTNDYGINTGNISEHRQEESAHDFVKEQVALADTPSASVEYKSPSDSSQRIIFEEPSIGDHSSLSGENSSNESIPVTGAVGAAGIAASVSDFTDSGRRGLQEAQAEYVRAVQGQSVEAIRSDKPEPSSLYGQPLRTEQNTPMQNESFANSRSPVRENTASDILGRQNETGNQRQDFGSETAPSVSANNFDTLPSNEKKSAGPSSFVPSDGQMTEPPSGVLGNVVAEETDFQRKIHTPVGERTEVNSDFSHSNLSVENTVQQTNIGEAEFNSAFQPRQENRAFSTDSTEQDGGFVTASFVRDHEETDRPLQGTTHETVGERKAYRPEDAAPDIRIHQDDLDDNQVHVQSDLGVDDHSGLGAAQRAYEAEMRVPTGHQSGQEVPSDKVADHGKTVEQGSADVFASNDTPDTFSDGQNATHGDFKASAGFAATAGVLAHEQKRNAAEEPLDSRSGLGVAQQAYEAEMHTPVGMRSENSGSREFASGAKIPEGRQNEISHVDVRKADSVFTQHDKTVVGDIRESSESAQDFPVQDGSVSFDVRSGLGEAQQAYEELMRSPEGSHSDRRASSDRMVDRKDPFDLHGKVMEEEQRDSADLHDVPSGLEDHRPHISEPGTPAPTFKETRVEDTSDSMDPRSGLGAAQKAYDAEMSSPVGLHAEAEHFGSHTDISFVAEGDKDKKDPITSKIPREERQSFQAHTGEHDQPSHLETFVSGENIPNQSVGSGNHIRPENDSKFVESIRMDSLSDDRAGHRAIRVEDSPVDSHSGLGAAQQAFDERMSTSMRADEDHREPVGATAVMGAAAVAEKVGGESELHQNGEPHVRKNVLSDAMPGEPSASRLEEPVDHDASTQIRSEQKNGGVFNPAFIDAHNQEAPMDFEDDGHLDHSGLREAQKAFEKEMSTPAGVANDPSSASKTPEMFSEKAVDRSAPVGHKLEGSRTSQEAVSFEEKIKGPNETSETKGRMDHIPAGVRSELMAEMDDRPNHAEGIQSYMAPEDLSMEEPMEDHSALGSAQKAYEEEFHTPIGVAATKAAEGGEPTPGTTEGKVVVPSAEERLSGAHQKTVHSSAQDRLADATVTPEIKKSATESRSPLTAGEKAVVLEDIRKGAARQVSPDENTEEFPIDQHSELGVLQRAYEEELNTPIGKQKKAEADAKISPERAKDGIGGLEDGGIREDTETKVGEKPAGKARTIAFAAGTAAAMAQEAASSVKKRTTSSLGDQKKTDTPLRQGAGRTEPAVDGQPVASRDGLHMAQAAYEADMSTPVGKSGKGVSLNFNSYTRDELNKRSGKSSVDKRTASREAPDKAKDASPLQERETQPKTEKATQEKKATSLFELGKTKSKESGKTLGGVKGGQLNLWFTQGRRLRIINAEKQIAESAGRAAAALFFMGAGEHAEGARSVSAAASLVYVTVGMSVINKARSLLNIPSKNELNTLLASMKNPITGRNFADVKSYQRFLNQKLAKLGAKGMPLMSGTQLQILAARQINRLKIAHKLGKISTQDFKALMAIYQQHKKLGRLTAFTRPKKFKLRARLTRLMFMLDRFMPRSEATIGLDRIKRYTRMAVKSVQIAATGTILAAKGARIVGKKAATLAAKGVLAGYKAAKKANIINQSSAEKIEKTASKAANWAKEQQRRGNKLKESARNVRERLRDPLGIKSRLTRWKAEAWSKVVNHVPFVGRIANVFSGIGNAFNVVKVAVTKVLQWAALLLAGIIGLLIVLNLVVSAIAAIFGAFDFNTSDVDVQQVAIDTLQDCYEEDFSKILDVASDYNTATIDYADIKDQDKYDEWKAEAGANDFIQSTNAAEILSMTLVYFDMDLTSKEDGTDTDKTVSKNEVKNYVKGLYHGSHEILVDVTYEYEIYDTGEVDENGEPIMAGRTLTYADITYRTNYFESLFECTSKNATPITYIGAGNVSGGSWDEIYATFRDAGMTHNGACGIMGNLIYETGGGGYAVDHGYNLVEYISNHFIEPNATSSDGYNSYGIIQWTGSRKTNLKTWCSANGYDYTTIDGQLAFLLHEIQTSYRKSWNVVTSDSYSAYDAGVYIASHYEVCAVEYREGRGTMADAFSQIYGSYSSDWSSLSGTADGNAIVEYAETLIGTPRWEGAGGNSNPESGFDCSGFVWWVMSHTGHEYAYKSTHTMQTLVSEGKAEYVQTDGHSWDNWMPGDIILFSGHTGIYAGDGYIIHSSSSKKETVKAYMASPNAWAPDTPFVCGMRMK